MLDIVLNLEDGVQLEMGQMKLAVGEIAAAMKDDTDETYDVAKAELKKKALVELKGAPASVAKSSEKTDDEKSVADSKDDSKEKPKDDEKKNHEEKTEKDDEVKK
jgi:hypothetical protein